MQGIERSSGGLLIGVLPIVRRVQARLREFEEFEDVISGADLKLLIC